MWLAGLLEGEGSFMSPSPSEPNCPKITLQMTDRDVVEKAARLMGITYIHERAPKNPKWKTTYRICVKGARAVELMKLLRMHMGQRRHKKIGEILEVVNIQNPGDNTRKLTAEQAQEIKSLSSTQTVSELSRRFGVSRTTVRKVVAGKSWRSLQ
ncbi:HNH endonuclease [Myxococcus phage Mx1]|nr:HNH endonuclease [Myxococcus phage Mx1]